MAESIDIGISNVSLTNGTMLGSMLLNRSSIVSYYQGVVSDWGYCVDTVGKLECCLVLSVSEWINGSGCDDFKIRIKMHRRRTQNNFTYVSPCVKYMIFLLNFVFWVSKRKLMKSGLYYGFAVIVIVSICS